MQGFSKNIQPEHTIWRLVDNHWVNVSRELTADKTGYKPLPYSGNICDYLWILGFEIPETISYCLASNSKYDIKYRVQGQNIHIYLSLNKYGY